MTVTQCLVLVKYTAASCVTDTILGACPQEPMSTGVASGAVCDRLQRVPELRAGCVAAAEMRCGRGMHHGADRERSADPRRAAEHVRAGRCHRTVGQRQVSNVLPERPFLVRSRDEYF